MTKTRYNILPRVFAKGTSSTILKFGNCYGRVRSIPMSSRELIDGGYVRDGPNILVRVFRVANNVSFHGCNCVCLF